MTVISRRIQRLEDKLAPKRSEEQECDRRIASVLRERWCRRKAQERGVPYEQVLQESLTQSRVPMEGYAGDGTIADTMRFIRRRELQLSQAACSGRIEPIG